MKKVDVYTDGGCFGNPGPGGWAALIYEGPKPTEISGHEKTTTNQRMELRAAVESLKYLASPTHVKLHSDSAYLINGMRQKWYLKWQENGWLNLKKPVENPDLWKELIRLSHHHNVDWIKVKGHLGKSQRAMRCSGSASNCRRTVEETREVECGDGSAAWGWSVQGRGHTCNF